MSLHKSIKSGKEYRKEYRKAKAVDPSCRNHGSCPWCEENRLHKNKKINRLQLEIDYYKEMVEKLQHKIEYDDYLQVENRKMIEWVQKILKEFGTFEVNQRSVQIPIMKRKELYYEENNTRMKNETIIIPEIIINKVEY